MARVFVGRVPEPEKWFPLFLGTLRQTVEDGPEPIGQIVEHRLLQNRPTGLNAKNAGGRNLVGQRCELHTEARLISKCHFVEL
jgi:hypothetical protein